MELLKIGIVGLGHQVKEDHLPGIKDSQYAKLEAICDINSDLVSKIGIENEIRSYFDFKTMLDNEKLDFIIAAVPHNQYKSIIESSAKQGVHILKEKPFAISVSEAKYFAKLAKENNIEIMTTLQRRFNPIYKTFFQLIDQIGKPFLIDAKYSLFVKSPHEGWRGDKEKAGGGCIIDMGYHMIDMIIWYFGLPNKIQARYSNSAKPDEKYDAEDTASILFSYDNGLNGSLLLSRFYAPKTEYLRVIGSKGVVDVQRGSIKRFKEDGTLVESLIRENAWPSASTNQIDYFCQVLKGEKENIGSPNYHLQHASFVEACYKSMEENRFVDPKEFLNNEK
ncbi:MAG: Gfo/Idh/MocA family protein [Candidatus Woesearchaeota archaeon]